MNSLRHPNDKTKIMRKKLLILLVNKIYSLDYEKRNGEEFKR